MPISSERAVVTHRDHLELQAWQAPDPAAGEVRIRVAYSAVSFGDVMLRRHVFRRRPAVPVTGYEVVGAVEAVGAGVDAVREGDRVAAFVEYGGNARHAIVPARDLVPLPAQVAPDLAAAAVLNYATALGMIEAAGLVAGDDFAIHGATGGVGTAVLDVGRAAGLRAIGTTRAPRGDLFGARLVDARSPTLAGDIRTLSRGGVRAVFDGRAGRGLWGSRAMLRRGGSLVVFGLSSLARRGPAAALGTAGTLASLGLFRLLPGKRSTLFAIDRAFHRDPARVRAWVARAIAMLDARTVAPMIGARLPLGDVARGHRLVESGAVVGKVILDCR